MSKSSDTIIGEMHTDIKWIKTTLEKKANKWVERVIAIGMLGCVGWAGNQLLGLIPKVQALFN